MSGCFERTFNAAQLDREPFVFPHRLLGHEALSLDNLAKVVAELPTDQVFASQGILDMNSNFDRAHIEHRPQTSLREMMECIRTANAYVMVRQPEAHPSFRGLFESLKSEVEEIMGAADRGDTARDPMLYLFIASPNSVTPFHIDRYSTFLLQFQGQKTLSVYPAWKSRLVSPRVAESFVARSGERPTYDPALEHMATAYSFAPGQALHIPFLAPHHVKNGPDDVSISLSIIFNTDETMRQIGAMRFNDKMRRSLGRFGARPFPAGRNPLIDRAKAFAFQSVSKLRGRPGVEG